MLTENRLGTTSNYWVDNYGDYLYRFAFLRLNDVSLAEDMVQETFLSALKNIPSFRNQSSEQTWLTSILKNKIIDNYRKKMNSNISINEEEIADPQGFLENGKWDMKQAPENWETIPDKLYEQNEFNSILSQCLAGIPERTRSIFILREIDGFSSDKICNDLALSPSNLWVIMHRARTLLRKCLEINWFGIEKKR